MLSALFRVVNASYDATTGALISERHIIGPAMVRLVSELNQFGNRHRSRGKSLLEAYQPYVDQIDTIFDKGDKDAPLDEDFELPSF